MQAQRTSTGSRPKAKDFNDLTQEALGLAILLYRCLLTVRHGFPDHAAELNWVREAWSQACRKLNIVMELTPTLSKLVYFFPGS